VPVPLSRAVPSDLLDAAWSYRLAVTPAQLGGSWPQSMKEL